MIIMIFPKVIDHIHFDTIDSTHEWAKKNISSFHCKHLTAITTRLQTSGRGRIKTRAWVSKDGNFHFTGFFTLPKTIPYLANFSQVLIISVVQLFEQDHLSLQIKWPNDLVFENKKLGGAFTELIDLKDEWGCIASMGLNVNTSVETDQPTTSLKEISGKTWELNDLKSNFLEKLQSNLSLLCNEGFSPFLSFFNQHLAFKNKKITCMMGEKKISGVLSSVTNEGKLQLIQDDGSMIAVSSGEIHTLREIR